MQTRENASLDKSKNKKSQKSLVDLPMEVSQLKNEKFVANPPLLVRELLKAKTEEHTSKMKLRDHLIVESKLRQQLAMRLKQEVAQEHTLDLVN